MIIKILKTCRTVERSTAVVDSVIRAYFYFRQNYVTIVADMNIVLKYAYCFLVKIFCCKLYIVYE